MSETIAKVLYTGNDPAGNELRLALSSNGCWRILLNEERLPDCWPYEDLPVAMRAFCALLKIPNPPATLPAT